MVGLSAMVVGMGFRVQPHLPVWVGLLIGLAVGTLLGAFNGGLIAWLRVPPIIATLGSLSAYRGLVFIVSGGVQVDSNSLPDALTDWSAKGPFAIGGVTIPWILFFVVAVGAGTAWLVRKSRFGRDVFAIGSNPEGALLRGVPVRRILFWVYALCGALCGLAGVLFASRFTFVNPATAGQGFELVVIAAVVIGGTKVTGGSGSVLGVLLGCLLLGAINVALAVLGIAGTWQLLVYGLVILVAIIVDHGARSMAGSEE
jgi:rhamnose transport system permease protein